MRGSREEASDQAVRVPAAELETIVEDRLCKLLRDEPGIYQAAATAGADVQACKKLLADAAGLAARWPAMPSGEKRTMLQRIVTSVTVSAGSVDIEVDLARLLDALQTSIEGAATGRATAVPTAMLSVPAKLTRTGQQMQLLVQGAADGAARDPDRSLVRVLAQARQLRDMVMQGQGRAMGDLAAAAGVSPSYFTIAFRLGFLSPEITQAILQGRQPATLTARRLKLITDLDPSWSEQCRQVGLR